MKVHINLDIRSRSWSYLRYGCDTIIKNAPPCYICLQREQSIIQIIRPPVLHVELSLSCTLIAIAIGLLSSCYMLLLLHINFSILNGLKYRRTILRALKSKGSKTKRREFISVKYSMLDLS